MSEHDKIYQLRNEDGMTNKVQLNTQIDLIEDETNIGEAFASVSLNPFIQWAKIIVTDDQPNVNKQRVPKEEFENLISTGLFAPIKMTESSISAGHKEAQGKVIGTITQLLETGNKIVALSALWKKEREQDVDMLKQMFKEGNLPQVSWEITYTEGSVDDDGVETLHGTSLNGLTVVSRPAYAGRTPVVAMASEDDGLTEEEIKIKMDELEKAQAKISELEAKVTELQTSLSEVQTAKASADSELEGLREYKELKEKQEADAARLAEIKTKFAESKIEKDEKYFEDNKEFLLGLETSAFDFMLQELVAFAANHSAQASATNTEIPNFVNKETGKIEDPTKLGQILRESRMKTK